MTAHVYRAPEPAWMWEGTLPPVGTEYEVDMRCGWDEMGRQRWERQRFRVTENRDTEEGRKASLDQISARVLKVTPCPRCRGHGVLVREQGP